MNIELKQAAQRALAALENSQPHPSNPVIGLTDQDFIDHKETIRQLRNAIQQAEVQQTATPEPVWFHKHWGDDDDIFYRPDDKIPSGSTPLYTHPAPSGLDDSKRLDYLQDRGATIDLIAGVANFYPMRFRVGGLDSSANIDVRAAIDVARKATK